MNLLELEDRIQMRFPKDKLEEILYHTSYQPQDPILRKRNKEYVQWGRTIVQAAYSLYLYRKYKKISDGELSSKIAWKCSYIENNIFEEYKLEDFVLKGDEELHNLHKDVVPKLIVLLYQQYGFVKVYNFLLPFIENVNAIANVDYKTLVQEYAQARKLSPVYKVLDNFGPEHEKKYVCTVSIGNKLALGVGIDKGNAEKEAAKSFILKYDVLLIQKDVLRTKNEQIQFLSDERIKELNAAIRALHLNKEYISYHQMNEALTHVSYINKHPNLKYCSNTFISIVGDKVLSMLCFEYIFERYDVSLTAVMSKLGVLLQKEKLSKSIPNVIIDYILSTFQVENEKTRSRLKIDALKSVIGMMWENYITQNNYAIADFVKRFAYKILTASTKEKAPDFRTFLQNIVQAFSWSFANIFEIKTNNANNDTIVISTITVKGADWEEIGSGAGSTKTSASNTAAKDILLNLLPHSTENKTIEAAICRILDPELLCEYETKKKQRHETIDEAVKDSVISKQESKITKPLVEKHVRLKTLPKVEIPQEVSFDGAEHVLYICKGTITCRNNNHEIISSTGILASLSGKSIRININYCKVCKVYFISLTEYKYYKDLYGVLLGNFSIRQAIKYNESIESNGYDSLANESVLHLYGYSVNQMDDLSTWERRRILGNLMDREIVSKYRIIEHLQFFINNSKCRNNMKLANQKWSDDLEWVRSYNIDKQRKYIITTLKVWK